MSKVSEVEYLFVRFLARTNSADIGQRLTAIANEEGWRVVSHATSDKDGEYTVVLVRELK